MLRLINELEVFYKRENKNDFVKHVSSTVITPIGNFPLVLLYASHIFNQPFNKKFIQKIIKNNFVVIYFTDKIPNDALIDESIVYIKAKWRYFDPTTIKNMNMFSAIGGIDKKGEKLALQVARIYKKDLIRENTDLKKIKRVFDKENKNITILFDTIFDCGDRGLGDILLTTPIVRELKRKFKAEITYAVRPEGIPLLQNNSHIDKIVTRHENLDRTRYTYHLPLIRHTENYKIARNRQNRIDSMAELFMVNIKSKDKKPLYYVTKEEKSWAKSEIARTHKIKLGINIEATSPSRRWTISYLKELFEILDKNKFEIYLFGTGGKFNYGEIPEYVNSYVNKTSLREACALVSEMDIMLNTDSIYSHISGALDIPQVTLYTSIPADWRNAYYRSIGIQGKTECSPCCDFQFIKREDYDKCDRYGTPPCVKSITPKIVKAEINKCMRRYSVKMKKRVKQILINRSSGLGDILMITSVIHEIRKINPEAFISFRTNHTEILKHNEDIDDLIYGEWVAEDKLNEMFRSYDKIYNFDYSLEPPGVAGELAKIKDKEYMTVPRFDLIYRHAKIKKPDKIKMYYKVEEKEDERAKKIINSLNKFKKTIIYVVNSTSPYRTYPVDKTLNVLETLLKDYNVITTGNNLKIWSMRHYFNKEFYDKIEQFDEHNFLNLVDKIDIRLLFALIKNSDCCITPDTGTLHIAHAVNTSCVALFGNIDPYLRVSYYEQTKALYANIECAKECGDRGKLIKEFGHHCPCKTEVEKNGGQIGGDCMIAIEEEKIINEINSILKPGDIK